MSDDKRSNGPVHIRRLRLRLPRHALARARPIVRELGRELAAQLQEGTANPRISLQGSAIRQAETPRQYARRLVRGAHGAFGKGGSDADS